MAFSGNLDKIWLWLDEISGQAIGYQWLGFGFGTKAKKPWLFGLRPKPEHHYLKLCSIRG
jgi:hypothetical protein